MRGIRPVELVLVAAVVMVFAAAPTPGDVGGCGKAVAALDLAAFSRARKNVDCQRCHACGLTADRCRRACDPSAASDVLIPPLCRPLAHDGDVCVRALEAASCSDYAAFVDDVRPEVPSECDFCHALVEAGAP